MMWFEKLESFASKEIIALPAAIKLFFSRAASYLAVGRATITFTELFAANLHHCAQQIIAFIVVLERLELRNLCQHIRHLIESVVS